jgi:hypothetical protein
VGFAVAFSTVFQALLTTFLIDSGYKTPIQNMDELFASDVKLALYPFEFNAVNRTNEREASKILRNSVDCPSFKVCLDWAIHQKNTSVSLSDISAELMYASGLFVGENSEPLLCKLEDGVYLRSGLTMLMLQGDPLLRRVSEIIDRVVEAGIYNYWVFLYFHRIKILSHKISFVQPLDGYYSFNLYHMQPAFYLLLMGWCLSAICFIVEVLYNRVLSKRKLI